MSKENTEKITREYKLQPEFCMLGPDFITPVKVTYNPGYQPQPYYPLTFALKYEDEDEPRSLFASDKSKPWNHTKASLLLADEGLPIHGAHRMLTDKETNVCREAIMYSISLYDPTHPMFKPTVLKAVDYAMNLETEVTIEAVLAFDDAIYPIYKTQKTFGSYAMSLATMYHDIITEMQDYPDELLDEISKTDKCVRKCTEDRDGFDGYHICTSSKLGDVGEIDLDEDSLRELYRHLVSFRIISHKETIHTKSLDDEPESDNIVPATFVSVWNIGEYTVETKCRVNMTTKQISNIEVNHDDPNIEAYDSLDEEYIIFEGDNEHHEVQRKSETGEDYDGFWYD